MQRGGWVLDFKPKNCKISLRIRANLFTWSRYRWFCVVWYNLYVLSKIYVMLVKCWWPRRKFGCTSFLLWSIIFMLCWFQIKFRAFESILESLFQIRYLGISIIEWIQTESKVQRLPADFVGVSKQDRMNTGLYLIFCEINVSA